MTTFRSLAAGLPDFRHFRSLDPAFFLTISLAFLPSDITPLHP